MIRFVGVLGLWLGLVLFPVLLNWKSFCYHTWDLGIYAQALFKIAQGEWNPWLSVRNIKIFNDHFDPVLLLLAWVTRWVEPSLAGLLIEAAFILGTAFLCVCRGGSKILVIALFLFNPAVTSAVTFPVHPGTWSVLPLIGWLLAIRDARLGETLAWALCLLLFKEEYLFVVLGVGGVQFFGLLGDSKEVRKTGLFLILIGLFWAILVFGIRPKILGDTENYTSSFLKEWIHAPIQTFSLRVFNVSPWKRLFLMAAPFLPLLILYFRLYRSQKITQKIAQKNFFLAPVTAFLILFGIRFISNRWGFHYDLPLLACGLVWMDSRKFFDIPRFTVLFSLLITLVVQGSFVENFFLKTFFKGGLSHCPNLPTRQEEFYVSRSLLQKEVSLQPSMPVLATGYLIPRILEVSDVRHLELVREVPKETFLVYIEKSEVAHYWPIGREALIRKVEEIRQNGTTQVLFTGRWIQLERISSFE